MSIMGIPSYFSYIIKNHVNIVRKLSDTGTIHHLFMDCNSIIYDIFHALPVHMKNEENFNEPGLIETIIDKIREYVQYIRPSKTLFIAFDGVAPLAKMDQQRTRRHKTLWTSTPGATTWSTCNITPGTPFMQMLSDRVNVAFSEMGIETVIVSSSLQCGEGEHKLFQHIRKQSLIDDTAAVYGLDSDLIMLSLFHCERFAKLYVFRETPEFIKNQIPCCEDPCHFLDIGHLCGAILREMKTQNPSRIYDYVFMCFFLGNDFLPHFPSLNLRSNGLQFLLHSYRKVFGNAKYSLIDDNKTIQWKQVRRFILYMANKNMIY